MFVHLYLGAHNIREDEESQLEFKVFFEDIIIHPDWNFAIFANDIALVPLPEKIQFRGNYRRKRLQKNSDSQRFNLCMYVACIFFFFRNVYIYRLAIFAFIKFLFV